MDFYPDLCLASLRSAGENCPRCKQMRYGLFLGVPYCKSWPAPLKQKPWYDDSVVNGFGIPTFYWLLPRLRNLFPPIWPSACSYCKWRCSFRQVQLRIHFSSKTFELIMIIIQSPLLLPIILPIITNPTHACKVGPQGRFLLFDKFNNWNLDGFRKNMSNWEHGP